MYADNSELDAVPHSYEVEGSRDRGVDIRLAFNFCSRKVHRLRRQKSIGA